MKSLSFIVTAISLGMTSTQIYAGDYNFEPGLWETTTTLKVIGGPAEMMNIPPETEQECVKGNFFEYESNDECKSEHKWVSNYWETWVVSHRQRPFPAWMRGWSPHGWVHGESSGGDAQFISRR